MLKKKILKNSFNLCEDCSEQDTIIDSQSLIRDTLRDIYVDTNNNKKNSSSIQVNNNNLFSHSILHIIYFLIQFCT